MRLAKADRKNWLLCVLFSVAGQSSAIAAPRCRWAAHLETPRGVQQWGSQPRKSTENERPGGLHVSAHPSSKDQIDVSKQGGTRESTEGTEVALGAASRATPSYTAPPFDAS
jgi:hypothetical protein